MKEKKQLTGKDLINTGIYTCLTLAVLFVFGLLTTLPVLYPFLLFLWPLVCGIPMMLYYTKINTFGMLTLTGLLLGLFFFLIGYTWIGFLFWCAGGFAADLTLYLGGFQKFKTILVSYAVFSLGMMGAPAPMWFAGQAYWDMINSSMGQQYADTLSMMMPKSMLYIGFLILFAGGICGAFLGRRMLEKHFKRAGIA